MNLRIIVLASVFILVIGTAFVFWRPLPERVPEVNQPTQDQSLQEYANERYGISFSYPPSYVLAESDSPGGSMREHHTITLTRAEDLPLPVNGEGPPTITINIHQNDLDSQTTEGWIKNTSLSNYKLSEGILATTRISGLPALSYRWSGLYEGTTIVTAQPKWVYAFTVTYLEMGSPIVQDFVALRESVKLSL